MNPWVQTASQILISCCTNTRLGLKIVLVKLSQTLQLAYNLCNLLVYKKTFKLVFENESTSLQN